MYYIYIRKIICTYIYIYAFIENQIGRKGIEPLTASTIEFTAQPVVPTNGTFLYIYYILLNTKFIKYVIYIKYFIKY